MHTHPNNGKAAVHSGTASVSTWPPSGCPCPPPGVPQHTSTVTSARTRRGDSRWRRECAITLAAQAAFRSKKPHPETPILLDHWESWRLSFVPLSRLHSRGPARHESECHRWPRPVGRGHKAESSTPGAHLLLGAPQVSRHRRARSHGTLDAAPSGKVTTRKQRKGVSLTF